MSQFLKRPSGRYGMHSGSGSFKNVEVQGDLWVKGGYINPGTKGNIFFVSSKVGASGNGKSWDTAFLTIQEAVNACASQTTDTEGPGDIVVIGPGTYEEQVVIYQKRNLTITGWKHPCMGEEVRCRRADTYTITTSEATEMTGGCFVVLSRGTEICNLMIDASGARCGIYIGDGGRTSHAATTEEVPDCVVHDCHFKYGTVGLFLDGAESDISVYNNYFYRQSDDCIHLGPGSAKLLTRVLIYNNFFIGEKYGLYFTDHAGVTNAIISGNVFADSKIDTTTMTAPIYSNNAAHYNQLAGNFFVCNASPTVGTLDYCSGNSKGAKGSYVDGAEA